MEARRTSFMAGTNEPSQPGEAGGPAFSAPVAERGLSVSILIPVFDDWTAASMVIRSLAGAFLKRPDIRVRLLLVDDGSAEPVPGNLSSACSGFQSVTILHLRFNLGHQRAIAIGLSWLREEQAGQEVSHEAVLVMDGDGEDRAEDAVRLVDRFFELRQNMAVFAARRRRTETRLFWLGYHAYRTVHWILTGIAVEIGNFSVLSPAHLGVLTFSPDLWSHYAAAAVKTRLPICKVPMDRGVRVAGRSKMNYVSLTRHGLSALGVFGSIAAARLLLAAAFAVSALFSVLVVSYVTYAFTGLSFAAWDIQLIGIVLVLLTLCLIFSISIASTAFADRSGFPLAPAYNYRTHIERTETVR